jgi:predicted ATPase
MPLIFNPFKPNSIVHPAMFVGRVDELRIIERCLFQTKNENPQHFLVQGERGIGKSSLLFYVNSIATGQMAGIFGGKFNFLTVQVDLGACSSQLDIVRKVGRGLKSSFGKKDNLKETGKKFWEWLSQWEVLGVQFHKSNAEIDLEQISEDLVSRLATFMDHTNELDGVLILVDEADRPSADAGLGEFLKLFVERLNTLDCQKVLVGIAGLPVLVSRLRDSHESSPRLFQTLTLQPLERNERKDAVAIGLDSAKEKNGFKTDIADDAMELLAQLSEGYPHFVQQFSFCAFERSDGKLIQKTDVLNGSFEEGGAISQLGDKFFNEMYHARISSEDYRRVLDAMAEHGDSWVSRQDIISESRVVETTVTNALRALKAKEIILQDDKQRGLYRLPTNSFAAWINATKAARSTGSVGNEVWTER